MAQGTWTTIQLPQWSKTHHLHHRRSNILRDESCLRSHQLSQAMGSDYRFRPCHYSGQVFDQPSWPQQAPRHMTWCGVPERIDYWRNNKIRPNLSFCPTVFWKLLFFFSVSCVFGKLSFNFVPHHTSLPWNLVITIFLPSSWFHRLSSASSAECCSFFPFSSLLHQLFLCNWSISCIMLIPLPVMLQIHSVFLLQVVAKTIWLCNNVPQYHPDTL